MSALAQDATPTGGAEPPQPVHIHSGTCDALGDVVYPLNDIITYNVTNAFSFGLAATPEAGSMATPLPGVSVTQTTPVLFSFTHVDANLVDLVGGGYAINAHESAENIQNYIACGNIPHVRRRRLRGGHRRCHRTGAAEQLRLFRSCQD